MSFLPGEPVPPGFEEDDDVTRTAVIQKQIENYTAGPLIGTEYTIELHEPAQLRPNYFCVLCQTCTDGRNVFAHWTSQAHRTKYLQTHFQKAHRELQKLKRTPNSSGDLVTATGNLVKCIEKHFGRSRNLITATGDDFRRYRSKMCSQVRDSFHFDECAGSDFSEEAQRVIRELKPDESIKSSLKMNVDATGGSNKQHEDGNIIALDAISSDDENFGGSTGPVDAVPKGRQTNNSSEDAGGRSKNQSPPPPGGATKTQHLPTPKELAIQASIISQERYKWEKFRCMLELQLKQLRSDTEMYESNPEKHPDYPDEWKQFWNRRYKQLQEEKKFDPNLYDYKPEWISYWKDRRIVLFDIAVNKIKKELKEKFKLGDEDEEKTKELMERYKIRVASPRRASATTNADNGRKPKPNFRSNRPIGAVSKLADAVIDISDDDVDTPPSRGRASLNRRSISRSLSPKRGGRRAVRRSRSRSPHRSYKRGSSRSRSRSQRRRSRSPPHYRGRGHGRTPTSKERGSSSRDFGDRRSLQRDRERSSEYYPRNEGYARSSRGYEPVETFRVLDSRVYPEYSMTKARSISPTVSSNKEKEKEASEPVEEGPLTVVSVLRMLSAVEEHLGSLGPKALNLLSKALAMEMVKPNSAEDLLLNEDNCVFLETTKEKLKGILIAEVLDDPQKVRVVKKLITNIAAVIFQATVKGTTDAVDDKVKANANPAPIQLPFDRNLVAPKLANALVLKGYNNVTTGDMNNLLHLLTLLVKMDKQRRQLDKNNGLKFEEIKAKLGLQNKPSPDDMGYDLDELMKEVEHQLNKESVDMVNAPAGAPTKIQADTVSGMESLTDSDLQTLLQNFKFLSNEEQVHLIGHLRKLEVQEPSRVDRLRKYVNLVELRGDGESCSDFLARVVNIGGPSKAKPTTKSKTSLMGGRTSSALAASISATKAGHSMLSAQRNSLDRERDRDLSSVPINKQRRGRNTPGIMLDDDDEEDDDYNFDDLVMKACDSNGSGSGGGGAAGAGVHNAPGGPPIVPVESSPNALTFKPAAATKISLKDTENIIANLMGTLSKNGSSGGSPVGGNRNYMMNQQHGAPNAQNAPNLGQNPGQKQPGAGYSNAGYPGQQQQQQHGRNFGQEAQPLMSGGPNANHYPNQQGYGGYHPFAGNGVQQNYGGMVPPGPGGYVGPPVNPWASNVPPQPPFNQMPQNFMGAQQPHYNNMFGGRH
ncbi:uncharacterized protein CG7065 [Drosophila simulans]|uniref:uncharacterized protein CG7065 n=1 Tax=Drosophila simulans TaxID=7240 RepID=UPI00078AF1D8|nr:uncharacterized protein CG7065 [Drosophila simulans]KMZ08911.1 uncharacterized protein Dsimw501_GD16930 [Drosophila simulans]